ncbi:MFS transporter, MHS family, proline/betaine transporter [Enhydrobacter aerosaccus]|uniref:MFS transporter, MHS family, proline/betaine transporter n=1 Tax=Enhydrobacter aerosaccus TaxID=225324 RepID=A0A1T4T693_9HYPH|nr:MFS transporter [Enhydrobacter aerosaccus]SKA35976.1 MFS transporter, MHS family, proline/betaine transporter [Enhydrobacter aerosaccus]
MSLGAASEALALADVPAEPPAPWARQALAGAIGNVLEWYDFAVYGFFAAIFGKNFFPAGSAVISLAAAFGVFAAAFIMRPIGGALFGHIGDRLGRKTALLTSAGLMTAATVAIGFLPTFAQIGVMAPLLLIVMRMLQGLAVGGEFSTSIVFLVEGADPRRRGLLGSLASMGASSGILLGSGVGAFESWLLSQAQLESWGWRLPFLAGSVLGGSAFILRRVLSNDEPPQPVRHRLPLVEALSSDWRDILRGGIACASFATSIYLITVYLVTMMQQVDGLPASRALEINTVCLLVAVTATPCFGMLSDRVGRKPVLMASVIGTILLSWPLFWLLLRHDVFSILFAQIVFALLIGAWAGPMEATLVELYRGRTRCTALSLSYNLAFALLGGTAPIVAVYLVSEEHANFGPAFYLMGTALISLIGLLTIPDRTGQPLR